MNRLVVLGLLVATVLGSTTMVTPDYMDNEVFGTKGLIPPPMLQPFETTLHEILQVATAQRNPITQFVRDHIAMLDFEGGDIPVTAQHCAGVVSLYWVAGRVGDIIVKSLKDQGEDIKDALEALGDISTVNGAVTVENVAGTLTAVGAVAGDMKITVATNGANHALGGAIQGYATGGQMVTGSVIDTTEYRTAKLTAIVALGAMAAAVKEGGGSIQEMGRRALRMTVNGRSAGEYGNRVEATRNALITTKNFLCQGVGMVGQLISRPLSSLREACSFTFSPTMNDFQRAVWLAGTDEVKLAAAYWRRHGQTTPSGAQFAQIDRDAEEMMGVQPSRHHKRRSHHKKNASKNHRRSR